MFIKSTIVTLALVASTQAGPNRLQTREVPQEHSHNQFLNTVRGSLSSNNPLKIIDPVFGLLGNAAAAGGTSAVDPTCMQQATADQAFTNAKAARDVVGMTAALVYRALERNTGSVGQASVPCIKIKAVNPEIASIAQHQDPASPNAAAINKAVTLNLAKQIASIGGDPQTALKSGTFAPGTIGDNTARGHTCDTQDDRVGCIFSQNLLVEDATAAEIAAAVAGTSAPATTVAVVVSQSSTAAAATSTSTDEEDCSGEEASAPAPTVAPATTAATLPTVTVTVQPTNCAAAAPAAATLAPAPSSSAPGANLQKFTTGLGGILAPAVTVGGRGFQVAGEVNESDLKLAASIGRSCSIQHNKCANFANSNQNAGFNVGSCDAQNTACVAAQ